MKGGYIVLCTLLIFVGCTTAIDCIVDADCPTYNATAFCGSAVCVASVCQSVSAPCAAVCSETLRACVECERPSDCVIEGKICDAQLHTCRWCTDKSDCQAGTWCRGGQWLCVSDHCAEPPPSAWPCDDINACSEEGHHCNHCATDEDCNSEGLPYDYCTNRNYCDNATLTCVREDPLPEACAFCNNETRACSECIAHVDCRTIAWSATQDFCSPPTAVPLCVDGACMETLASGANADINDYWTSPCPADTAQLHYECIENRKVCTVRQLDNSVAIVLDQGLPLEPVGLAETCLSDADCRNLNWLCTTTSHLDANVRTCTPCRTNANCIRGSVKGTCNQTSGSCSQSLGAGAHTITLGTRVESMGTILLSTTESSPSTMAPSPIASSPIKPLNGPLKGEWVAVTDGTLLNGLIFVAVIGGAVLIVLLFVLYYRTPKKHRSKSSASNAKLSPDDPIPQVKLSEKKLPKNKPAYAQSAADGNQWRGAHALESF